MFKSSRKKLIAIGCSYTADWNTFPPWPTVLAEMLDMECVNLGDTGSGNDEILAKTIDTVLNEKNIGLIVLMWSEWHRWSFQQSHSDWEYWWHVQPHRQNRVPRRMPCPKHKLNVNDWVPYLLEAQNPHHITQQTFRTFIHAEKLLKDIPHLYVQGCFGIPWYNVKSGELINCGDHTVNAHLNFFNVNNSRKEVARQMILSPYLEYIEDNISKYFIGWPIMSEIGGYCFDEVLDKIDPSKLKLRISKKDSHPNGAGHKIIAQEIHNAYAKIYA